MATTPLTDVGLFTDLYELTMLQAYLAESMTDTAVFTLFVRRLPEHRNFLLACGLETVLTYLEQLRFTEDDLVYLRSLETFSDDFVTSLRKFTFTGDVDAVPEGTLIFANEPILEIVAPIAEAQLVETPATSSHALENSSPAVRCYVQRCAADDERRMARRISNRFGAGPQRSSQGCRRR